MLKRSEITDVIEVEQAETIADGLSYVGLTIKQIRHGSFTHNQIKIMCDQMAGVLEDVELALHFNPADGLPF